CPRSFADRTACPFLRSWCSRRPSFPVKGDHTAALPRERGGWILSSISLSRWGLPGGTGWHGVETPSRYHRPFLALERQGVSSAAGSEASPACGDALAVVVAERAGVAAGRLYELPGGLGS